MFQRSMVAGGGKNDIPNRLKRQFATFAVPQPSLAAINNIFGALINGRFPPGTTSRLSCGLAGQSTQ